MATEVIVLGEMICVYIYSPISKSLIKTTDMLQAGNTNSSNVDGDSYSNTNTSGGYGGNSNNYRSSNTTGASGCYGSDGNDYNSSNTTGGSGNYGDSGSNQSGKGDSTVGKVLEKG